MTSRISALPSRGCFSQLWILIPCSLPNLCSAQTTRGVNMKLHRESASRRTILEIFSLSLRPSDTLRRHASLSRKHKHFHACAEVGGRFSTREPEGQERLGLVRARRCRTIPQDQRAA